MRKGIQMKKTLLAISSGVLLAVLLAPLAASAALDLGNTYLENFGDEANYGQKTLPAVIGNIVKIILSLVGLVAVVLIIAAGFMWMTSGGSEEKVKKAKDLMGAAVIGLVIVVVAYAAATFIVNALTTSTEATP